MFAFLDRKHTVAAPNHNRWLIPPAALAIHLAIGQVYAFSVFNLPLTRVLGVSESVPGDWRLTDIGWIFSIAIVFLGLSAALFGKWLEREGPRKAMIFLRPCASAAGFIYCVSALGGLILHQIWLCVPGLWAVLGGHWSRSYGYDNIAGNKR